MDRYYFVINYWFSMMKKSWLPGSRNNLFIYLIHLYNSMHKDGYKQGHTQSSDALYEKNGTAMNE